MAPTSSLIEKSKASFEELRHHLHLPGLRARGSSTSPLRCLGFLVTGSGGSSSEGRNGSGSPSTSHSFAVLGQSPSARRGALDHGVGAGNTGPQLITTAGIAGHPNPSISSPIEVQQYHSIPEGLSYRLRKRPRETLFLANGNPGREDEYLPLSLPSQESETSHRRAYNEAARERADEDAREARAADAQAGRRRRRRRTSSHEIRRAYATGNDDWGRVIDDAVRARSPLSHVLGMGIPDWEIDVEGKLEGEVQRLVGEREFGLGEWVAGRVALVAAAQEMMPELPVSRPRHSRPRQEPEKQKAHILDPEVDYTVLRPTPTASESEAILPGLSTHDLASRDPPAQLPNVTDADTSYTRTDTARYRSLETQQSQGRRRLRRHLPHLLAPASSVEEAEAIYARIFDAETGREVTYLPSLQLENKDEGYHYQTRANTLSLIVNDSTTNHVSSPGTLSNPRNESASRNPPDVVKVDPILISSNQRAYERNNSSSSLSSSSSLRSRRRRHQHHHQIENRDRLRQQAAKLLHPTAWQELDSPPPPHPQGQTTSRPNSDSFSSFPAGYATFTLIRDHFSAAASAHLTRNTDPLRSSPSNATIIIAIACCSSRDYGSFILAGDTIIVSLLHPSSTLALFIFSSIFRLPAFSSALGTLIIAIYFKSSILDSKMRQLATLHR
ncbi:MAG: hypothetical protein L6R41_007368 [Letrouitia leprolyta]|nr:MAG: hypothetical protein L6R41_007368 [Letrouitia leprolyta]